MPPPPRPKTPGHGERTPKPSGTLNRAWVFVETAADHLLKLNTSNQAEFVVGLEATNPSVVITKICEAVVRRVAAGAVTPDVLAVFGPRILFPVSAVFHQAHQSSRQVRLLHAVIQFAPSFEPDVQRGLLIDLVFWDRAAVGRPAMTALARAIATVRDALEIDKGRPEARKRRRRSGRPLYSD